MVTDIGTNTAYHAAVHKVHRLSGTHERGYIIIIELSQFFGIYIF